MTVFYNPSFPQLGAEVALASGLLLPELFRMEFGAQEVALEAPEIFLAAPEMVPATELAWESARELETALELEPVMELAIAQSNRWVLSSQPLVSFAVADLLTWLGIILPEVLAARASLEEELLSATKAQKRDPELTP